MKKRVAGIFVLGVTSAVAAAAADYPSKTYDALYDRNGAQGESTYRMCSDGKGHMRIESEMQENHRRSVTIFNYPKQQMVMLLDQQKLAMVMPLKGETAATADSEAKVKALGGKALGVKVIDGHPCHGWTYTINGTTYESWTGDDTGCMVESTTRGPQGEEAMRLRTYSPTASADLFQVPAGYKLTSANTMFGGAQ